VALLALAAAPLWAAVSGVVTNGTTGKPQPGVTVAMMAMSEAGMEPLGSATTGADGSFTLEKNPPGPVLLQADWQGVGYNQVLTPGSPSTNLGIQVFDVSKTAGAAKVSQHLVLFEPGDANLSVSETWFFANGGNKTFYNPSEGALRFFLPVAAKGEVQVRATAPGGLPLDRTAAKTGKTGIYKVEFPIKPGDTRIDILYSVPFSPGGEFSSRVLDTSAPTRLIVPQGVTLSGPMIASMGQEPQTKAFLYQVNGARYDVKIEGTGSLRAAAETAGGNEEDSGPGIDEILPPIYDHRFVLVALALAILGVGFVMLYRRGSEVGPETAAPAAKREEKRR